ncbi:MAG: TonB-dependent receptor, partial [Flavobacteriales bacterium]
MYKVISTKLQAHFKVVCAQLHSKKFFLLMLFCGLFHLSEAQKISGKVTDVDSGEMLTGAVVIWQGTRAGTVTDIDGQFETTQPPGAKRLVASYVGYVSDTIVYSGENFLEIKLKAMASGRTIIIEDDRASTTMTTLNPLNFQTLGKKELCKAACCNLSESFETNASIDASFADAITGTKQIRMLGLDGKYTQMMFDNMPAIRGLASTYGLTYVPGPWVNNIYIGKGVGSVVGGFESITGQINVEYKSPETAEPLYVNAYLGSSGRTELNLIWTPHSHNEDVDHKTSDSEKNARERRSHFRPVFLAHGAMSSFRTDMNGDGFLDNPLFTNIILRNEWHLSTEKGLGAQFAATWLKLNNVSGKLDYNPKDEIRSQLWGVNIATDKYDLSAKVGYVFPKKTWKSFGSQYSASYHKQSGNFGYRQYTGEQVSGRVNLLFATRIKNDSHKITTGVSYLYDNFNERVFFKEFPPVLLSSMSLSRMESVGGAFAEYTMNWKERLIIVAGLRGDYHNRYGLFFTPRIHTRYSFTDKTSLKLLGGKGYRTANLLMDNVGILASNRNFVVQGNDPDGYFGLKMEQAWNTGVILTHKFKINHRDA